MKGFKIVTLTAETARCRSQGFRFPRRPSSQPPVFRREAFRGGDGVAVELGGELRLPVVAAAVEDGYGDAIRARI